MTVIRLMTTLIVQTLLTMTTILLVTRRLMKTRLRYSQTRLMTRLSPRLPPSSKRLLHYLHCLRRCG